MIKRRIILLAIIILSAFVVILADGNSPNWKVWLHNGNGHLILVDASGDMIDEIQLPLSDDYLDDSVQVTISPDNHFIAYTLRGGASSESSILRIYQPETDLILYETSTTTVRGFSSIVFDEQSRLMAFGIGGDSQNMATLMLVSTNAGTVVTTIHVNDIIFPDEFEDSNVNVISPEYFDGNSLVFARWGESNMTYQWYFDAEQMIELPNYPLSSRRERFDLTGEQVAIITNPNIQMANAPNAENNVITVYDPVTRSWSPFFARPIVINSVHFVQNGERILIHGEHENNDNLWILVERNGSVVRPLRNFDRRDIHGVADGFVYTYWNNDRETIELIHHDSRQALSDRTVWFEEGTWEIVWVDRGSNALSAFIPWAQIDETVYDPPIPILATTMEPTTFPMPTSIIYIGREVEVNTIDGEVLYLRDEPSTSGAIVMNLLDRMMLTIINGPIEADGYVWWQVTNEDGLEGWAAQAVDDVTTLLPR